MNFKKIALAVAAAAATTPAMAADLPVVAEPVNYVQACNAYGNGYFKLPGQDTCIRVHGRIRTQWTSHNLTEKLGVAEEAVEATYFNEDTDSVSSASEYAELAGRALDARKAYGLELAKDLGSYLKEDETRATEPAVGLTKVVSEKELQDRKDIAINEAYDKDIEENALLTGTVKRTDAAEEVRNDTSTLARGYVYLESMTATELMTIKTYTELQASWDQTSTGEATVEDAYVQLGFGNVSVLVGRTGSIYSDFEGYSNIGIIGAASGGEDAMQVSATASMGNGFTASFGLMDAEVNGGVANRANFESALAMTQGMFTANLSGVAHAYSDDDYGFGVAGTVEASVMENVKIGFGASYASNAVSYLGGAQTSGWSDGGADDLNGYTVIGGMEVGLSDKITAALDASYTKLDKGSADYDFAVINGSLTYNPVVGMDVVMDAGWSKDSADNKNAVVAARLQYSF